MRFNTTIALALLVATPAFAAKLTRASHTRNSTLILRFWSNTAARVERDLTLQTRHFYPLEPTDTSIDRVR